MQPVGVPASRAAAPRPPRSRPGRAGRAAPPGRAARAAARGRATAPARGARPAACRPRTCTSRCSRRAATTANGDADAVSTSTRSISRVLMPCSRRRSAGRSNTSCRHSRYVSSTIGNEPYLRATCSRVCAFSRCCQSGVRWPGRRRGISSARAGVLAEARAEERGLAELADDELLELRPGRRAAPRRAAARPRRAGAARCRRPTTATAPRGRAPSRSRAAAPAPTARGRGRRTASGCRRASRRSRRGTARRRPCGRTGTAPVASTCSRR